MAEPHPYRDPPIPSARWYRVKGENGFILNLHDVYICKWIRDLAGHYLLVSFKHGSWQWEGFRHNCIKLHGQDGTDLEQALLNL